MTTAWRPTVHKRPRCDMSDYFFAVASTHPVRVGVKAFDVAQAATGA